MKIVKSLTLTFFLFSGIFLHWTALSQAENPNKNSDSLFKQGKKLSESSPLQAYQKFTEALQSSNTLWKKRALCLQERGIVLFKLQKYPPAVADFNQAIKLEPTNFLTHKYLTKTLFLLHQLHEGLQESLRALELKDDDPELHYLRGRIFLSLHHSAGETLQGNIIASAVKEFDEAVDGKRNYIEAYFHCGMAYMVSGNFREAIERFGKALKYNKKLYQAWFEIANANQKLSDELQEVEALEECLKIRENYLPAYHILLPLCDKLHFTDKIAFHLAKAVPQFPEDPLIQKFFQHYPLAGEQKQKKQEEPEKAAPLPSAAIPPAAKQETPMSSQKKDRAADDNWY